MADNLPLIPNKRRGCSGDVRPVLRGSFRERAAAILPPLSDVRGQRTVAGHGDWRDILRREELRLRAAAANRLIPPGLSPLPAPLDPPLLSRKDLMPTVEENVAREASLWVKSILARTPNETGEPGRLQPSSPRAPATSSCPLSPLSQCRSSQTLSIGEIVVRPPPPPPTPPARTPLPELIVCVPASIDFVNFTLGQIHTMSIRLVNVSSVEVKLSLRPPVRRELDLQLCGRLIVTSGSSCEIRVHFRPSDVRAVHDEIFVRVSVGRAVCVPIACYMQPPLLDVLVPNLTMSSALLCIKDDTVVGPDDVGDIVDLGARLLGDAHRAPLLLRSAARHAVFFVLTEEAWYSQTITEVTSDGALAVGGFALAPVCWRGGGSVRGVVWCQATNVGLQALALRVLSSTAVARPLHILADSLYFHPDHITLQAQEKDYDICSDDDPGCDYYLNLGTAFPTRGLAASFQLNNHSPLTYSYYWSVRSWGVCTCWDEEASSWLEGEDDPETLCPGARAAASRLDAADNEEEAKDAENVAAAAASDAAALRVEPACGQVGPRASVTLHVAVPDVGDRLGTHRSVLVLVLKEIPRKSFPCGFVPMLASTMFIESGHIPGQKRRDREVCEVVCRQMEVWWRVAPLRFVLDPPLLELPHSRRVTEIQLELQATQLFAGGALRVRRPDAQDVDSSLLTLQPGQPVHFSVTLPLDDLPNDYPKSHIIMLESERGEWSSRVEVQQKASTRHPALVPPITWMKIVPPGAPMAAHLRLLNDTYQHIFWWADVFRWIGENPPKDVCLSRAACEVCRERQCTCALLRPERGALPASAAKALEYRVNAPDKDGVVCTVVRVRRTAGDASQLPSAAGVEARAVLLAYRVLAPRLVLSVLPCRCRDVQCTECALAESTELRTVLRPARALTIGRAAVYFLRITNTTPLATYVNWQPSPEVEDRLRVRFFPNEFNIMGYATVKIKVVLEPLGISGRRVWSRCAAVRHGGRPLYLLIDTCISGVELECWLPLVDEPLCITRKQRELFWWTPPLPETAEAAFAWDDARRALFYVNCPCKQKMKWIPPTPPKEIDIVTTPPPLTRVCECWDTPVSVSPPPEPVLQFRALPTRTVRSMRIHLRSVSVVSARWLAKLRAGAVQPERALRTAAEDWSARVRDCGVCVTCSAGGVLGARSTADVLLRAYADTWGLYQDQLLILVDQLAPLVVDVYLEAVGSPLQFARRPPPPAPRTDPEPPPPLPAPPPDCLTAEHYADKPPVLWLSSEQPVRKVRARNTSRAALFVNVFSFRDHEHTQDAYPFRLCMRMIDVLPQVCPCCEAKCESEIYLEEEASEHSVEMDTSIELFLAPDYGVEESSHFKVEPEECEVPAGGSIEWRISVRGLTPDASEDPQPVQVLEPVSPYTLLMRLRAVETQGPGWFRPEPAPAVVHVRTVVRTGVLQLSHSTIVVKLCALMLPYNDVMRVRKRLHVRNVGDGRMVVNVTTGDKDCKCPTSCVVQKSAEVEWFLLRNERHPDCGTACEARVRGQTQKSEKLLLPARSTTELCVEVEIHTAAVWPSPDDDADQIGEDAASPSVLPSSHEPSVYSLPPNGLSFELFKKFKEQLRFFDDINNVLETVPLVVEIELPALIVEPKVLDFGYVCDGDTRKTYFSVTHTSHTETLDVWIHWHGDADFHLHPLRLLLPPGATERVYVQYTAKWTGAVSYGVAQARCGGAAGEWCQDQVEVKGRGSRDLKCHTLPHDLTDDNRLLPPHLLLDQLNELRRTRAPISQCAMNTTQVKSGRNPH